MSVNLQSRTSSTATDDDPPPLPPSTPGQKILSQALTSTAYLSNLLLTGTLQAFQLLVPIFTHVARAMAVESRATLLSPFWLALSCFLASFPDSVTVSGKVYYRIATRKGLLLVDYRDPAGGGLPDLTKKRLRIIDGVHAAPSVLVFGAVVSCLYPSPGPAARGF